MSTPASWSDLALALGARLGDLGLVAAVRFSSLRFSYMVLGLIGLVFCVVTEHYWNVQSQSTLLAYYTLLGGGTYSEHNRPTGTPPATTATMTQQVTANPPTMTTTTTATGPSAPIAPIAPITAPAIATPAAPAPEVQASLPLNIAPQSVAPG